MVKKKLLNTYCIVLLGVLFAMFFGIFSNSYAMTIEQLDDYVEQFQDYLDENNYGVSYKTQYQNKRDYLIGYIENYDNIILYFGSRNYFMLFLDNNLDCYFSSTLTVTNATPNVSQYSLFGLNYPVSNFYNNVDKKFDSISGQFAPVQYFASNLDIYTDNTLSVIYSNYKKLEELNNNFITLTAVKSGQKFTFNDKDQLEVMLTGDYTIADFQFYVQSYINNEWQDFSSIGDYSILYNYENPYYIFWNNLNYYPVGNYRYCADYGNTGEQRFYSNEFQITSSVIDNTGTGTVGDQNININIDTGQTVDNIKDFLGEPTDISENQFSDNFPEVEVDDPTADFFTWFFEQIQSCFTVSSAQFLIFTLYNKEFRINSDDYILNIPILSSVIGVGSSIFIFYGIFQDIRKEIEKVKEGKFSEIGKDDITASMM